MTTRMIKPLSGLLSLLFAYSAVVQYNDPDPLRWAALYVAAALLAALSVIRPLPSIAPAVLSLGALFCATLMLPGVLEEAAWTGTEEERELVGLLLVGSWMLVLTVYHRRHERQANA